MQQYHAYFDIAQTHTVCTTCMLMVKIHTLERLYTTRTVTQYSTYRHTSLRYRWCPNDPNDPNIHWSRAHCQTTSLTWSVQNLALRTSSFTFHHTRQFKVLAPRLPTTLPRYQLTHYQGYSWFSAMLYTPMRQEVHVTTDYSFLILVVLSLPPDH